MMPRANHPRNKKKTLRSKMPDLIGSNRNIHNRFKEYMRDRGTTQKKLAEHTGESLYNIRRVLSNEPNAAPRRTVLKVAAALGIKEQDIDKPVGGKYAPVKYRAYSIGGRNR